MYDPFFRQHSLTQPTSSVLLLTKYYILCTIKPIVQLLVYAHLFPGGASGKEPTANAGDVRDMDLIPGSVKSPGGEHGNRLQYTCLENPMDRETWWAMSMGSQRVGHD